MLTGLDLLLSPPKHVFSLLKAYLENRKCDQTVAPNGTCGRMHGRFPCLVHTVPKQKPLTVVNWESGNAVRNHQGSFPLFHVSVNYFHVDVR